VVAPTDDYQVQSYYHREMYTLTYLLLVFWPISYGTNFVTENWLLVVTWVLSCASMSIFTLLPAIKVESTNLMYVVPSHTQGTMLIDCSLFGGSLMLILGVLYIAFEKSILQQVRPSGSGLAAPAPDGISRAILGVQVGLVALAMLVTRSSIASLQAKAGLPLGTQVVGWVVLITSLILPFAHSLNPNNHYLHRLAVIFLTFAPMFIILTISYEGLFYFAYSCTLISWVRLEHRVYRSTLPAHVAPELDTTTSPIADLNPLAPALATAASRKTAAETHDYRSLTLADARIALFFLYLLQSGFFSTGNIASISSFSLDAVYRLIPIFDPFSQGALLILKILAPFVLVSANLGILTKRLKLRGGALFAIVMGIGDWLTLRFFWAVRDEGSWLEIGESITVFAIASFLCVFVAALESVSVAFTGGVEFRDDEKEQTASGGKKDL